MSASISFRGYKQRRKLARSVVEWFFNHRKLNRFNVFLDIIDRRCRSTDAINGSCSTVDCMSRPRWFDIEMDNTQSDSDYITTLIHELVHVEQRLRGRHQHRVAWTDYSKWEGSVVSDDTPYRQQPWEIEAYRLEDKLYRMYLTTR